MLLKILILFNIEKLEIIEILFQSRPGLIKDEGFLCLGYLLLHCIKLEIIEILFQNRSGLIKDEGFLCLSYIIITLHFGILRGERN